MPNQAPLTPEQWDTVVGNWRFMLWVLARMGHPNRQSRVDAFDAALDGLMSAARNHRQGSASFSHYAKKCIMLRVLQARKRSVEAMRRVEAALECRRMRLVPARDYSLEKAEAVLERMPKHERMVAFRRFGITP